jgi:DNA invertase Pin-like site-specific DNA recombinase
MRVALYARVSRLDQEPDNQLLELRRYVAARGWEAVAFVEHGVSGAKDRRPVLDQLLADVRRRRFDAVVCWKLDRLGRNMRHLVTLLDELRALNVGFVTTRARTVRGMQRPDRRTMVPAHPAAIEHPQP